MNRSPPPIHRRFWPAHLVVGAALVATLAGCTEASVPAQRCASDAACPPGSHCGPAKSCIGDLPCADDAGCCVAERCELGVCRPRLGCSAVAACAEPSMRCEDGVCAHPLCDADSQCTGGARCHLGVCARKAPCDGRCAAGLVCAARVDRCVVLPSACAPGEAAIVGDEATLWHEGCAAPVAVCRPLPPLPAPQPGVPGRLLHGGDGLWDIGYDSVYGDLVVMRRSLAIPHAVLAQGHVAGVPTTDALDGDPLGPRRGIAAVGEDVGDPFAAALLPDGALAIVAAVRGGGVRWLEVTKSLEVRRSLALDPRLVSALALAVGADGRPQIAAFVPAPDAGGQATLELWRRGATQSEGAITFEQRVVVATPVSAVSSAAWRSMARGRGAMLDLALDAVGAAWIAAYDAGAGDVALLRPDGSKHKLEIMPRALVPGGSADFGRFPALALTPDGAVVATHDHAGGRLLWARYSGAGWKVRVLDDGARVDGHHAVGADATIQSHAGGWLVAGQDARAGVAVIYRVSADGDGSARVDIEAAGTAGFSPSPVALSEKSVVAATAGLTLDAAGALAVTRVLIDVVVTAP